MRPRHPLQDFARELRNDCTDVERRLWQHLRNRQIGGVKFRRQQPIETYIVDFVSFENKIVIELDGSQHSENRQYDDQRDRCLQSNGYRVLRFWNNDVTGNMDGVLDVIRMCCMTAVPPPPNPRPPGAGE